MKQLILITAFIIGMTSCAEHRRESKVVKVKSYKEKSKIADSDPSNDFIFWYLINLDGGTYAYHSSQTPVTSLRTISWVTSKTLPPQLSGKNLEEMEEMEEQETEVEVETDVDGQSVAESESESESSSEGSDAGSDAGGGDGGGGDGGGGGD